jgi:hypothetical protein
MKWMLTLVGCVFLAVYGFGAFFTLTFWGGGYASNPAAGMLVDVFNRYMILIPASCGVTAVLLLFLQWRKFSAPFYAVAALPIVMTLLFLIQYNANKLD